MSNTTITPSVGSLAFSGVAPGGGQSLFLTPGAGSLSIVGNPPAQGEYSQLSGIGGTLITWANLINGGKGYASPGNLGPGYKSAFFQATGTWGSSGSVQIEGSNDGTNWFICSAAALTAAGSFAALGATERPRYLRPHVTAGDATTSITVTGWFNS